MRRTLAPMIQNARDKVAKILHCDPSECVIVPGVGHALSTILFNLNLKAGDILVNCESGCTFLLALVQSEHSVLLLVSITYYEVKRSLQYFTDKIPGLTISSLELTLPLPHADIVSKFRVHIESLPRREGQTVVAIVDGICASPAVVMPWEQIVGVCQQTNVFSIVDAAHVVGQMSVDLDASRPDAWVSVRIVTLTIGILG